MGAEKPAAEPAANPFDPSNLRLSTDYSQAVGVEKLLTQVPVRKPSKQDFVRVNAAPEYTVDTLLIDLADEMEVYVVAPPLQAALADEAVPVRMFTAINRQGVIFLWPVKLPRDSGAPIRWHDSARDAAERAKENWVRVTADRSLGAYQVFRATGKLPDPVWPDKTFAELLEIAFRDRMIDRPDHPVLQRLRGEV